jgi:hypothetical protein
MIWNFHFDIYITMTRFAYFISILLILGLPFPGIATDGDVTYSAPYIWVNPETGQVEMKNPGPQPKTHPNIATQASVANVMAAEEGEGSGAGHAAQTEGDATAHVNPVHPLIVFAGMIASLSLIVVMGRSTSKK